jgi:hypothetical protein
MCAHDCMSFGVGTTLSKICPPCCCLCQDRFLAAVWNGHSLGHKPCVEASQVSSQSDRGVSQSTQAVLTAHSSHVIKRRLSPGQCMTGKWCVFRAQAGAKARSQLTHASEEGSTSSDCESRTTCYRLASAEPQARRRVMAQASGQGGGSELRYGLGSRYQAPPPPRACMLSAMAQAHPQAKEYESAMIERACVAMRSRAMLGVRGSIKVANGLRRGGYR